MRTIEQHCNETIQRMSLFRHEAQKLIEEVDQLSPQTIFQRCEKLSHMYKELNYHKERLFILLEFNGPAVLDATCVGDFQNELFKSIKACDHLYDRLASYREKFINRLCNQPSQGAVC